MVGRSTRSSPEENRQRKALQDLVSYSGRPALEPLDREALGPWLEKLHGALTTDAESFRIGDSRQNVLATLGDYLGSAMNRLDSESDLNQPLANAMRRVADLGSRIPPRFG